ncbi:efflux RND transporter periplasmic adaptor subunit [Shimia sp.]|uniref:efflux RND transporter periplasmic adaptor subunit n=1 Tax=Shimia sp. TaxID=1954381 RepID=UPI00329752FB
MALIIALYAIPVWLIFFKFNLLPWNRLTKILVSLVGLIIVLVVVGLLNTKTPSGRISVIAHVVEIASPVAGTIQSVTVSANEKITAGTVLFEVDPTPYRAKLDQAEADLKLAGLSYDRRKALFDRNSGATSQQDVDEARANLDGAQARKDLAQYNLDQTRVIAPADGIVGSIRISAGDLARAMDPVMPFIRTDSVLLSGVFSQNGVDAMPEGTPVKITFDRKPGKIFTATVKSISAGTASGQVEGGSALLSAIDIGSSSEVLVLLSWPDEINTSAIAAGSVGSATAIGPDAGAIGILATVLFYLKMLGAYL